MPEKATKMDARNSNKILTVAEWRDIEYLTQMFPI